MNRETINVRLGPTCVRPYTILDPDWCGECAQQIIWARSHLGNRTPLDPWNTSDPKAETVDHRATCPVEQRQRHARKACRQAQAESPKPQDVEAAKAEAAKAEARGSRRPTVLRCAPSTTAATTTASGPRRRLSMTAVISRGPGKGIGKACSRDGRKAG
jgi:hypothetical protein